MCVCVCVCVLPVRHGKSFIGAGKPTMLSFDRLPVRGLRTNSNIVVWKSACKQSSQVNVAMLLLLLLPLSLLLLAKPSASVLLRVAMAALVA